jgi:hypothetical protein
MTPHNLIVECESLGVSIQLKAGNIVLLGHPTAVENAAKIARPFKANLIEYLSGLDQFNIGESESNKSSPHPTSSIDPIHRRNNMAWEFMQFDGMSYSEAMVLAQEIVSNLQIASCEKAYVDVHELINRIKK